MKDENKLGQLAFNRLTILAALRADPQPSLKEQLREIEKQMVKLGWDGKAHVVTKTPAGFTISAPVPKGHVINVKQFQMNSKLKLR